EMAITAFSQRTKYRNQSLRESLVAAAIHGISCPDQWSQPAGNCPPDNPDPVPECSFPRSSRISRHILRAREGPCSRKLLAPAFGAWTIFSSGGTKPVGLLFASLRR